MAFYIREKTLNIASSDFLTVSAAFNEIGAWCISECPLLASYDVQERSDAGGVTMRLVSVSGRSALRLLVYNSYKNLGVSGCAVVGGADSGISTYGGSFYTGVTTVSLAWTDYGYASINVYQYGQNNCGSVLEVPISETETKVLVGGPFATSMSVALGNRFSFPGKVYNETENKYYDITVLPPTSAVTTFATWIKTCNAGIARVTLCTDDPSVDGFIPHDFEIYRASLGSGTTLIGSAARYISTSEGDFLCTAIDFKTTETNEVDTYNILLK